MGRAIIDYHNNLSLLHFELTMELVQPFLKKCPIHPCFLLRSISARGVTNVLEASWTGRFSNVKHRDLLTNGVRRSHPVNRTLLCFSPEQCLPWKSKNFDVNASQNRPNSSALKISFGCYLANIVGTAVSSQGKVISLVTFSDSQRPL